MKGQIDGFFFLKKSLKQGLKMGYRNRMFLEKIINQVPNSAEFAEMDTPNTSQAGHQSCNKDTATLK